jgi:hypothetical protein
MNCTKSSFVRVAHANPLPNSRSRRLGFLYVPTVSNVAIAAIHQKQFVGS